MAISCFRAAAVRSSTIRPGDAVDRWLREPRAGSGALATSERLTATSGDRVGRLVGDATPARCRLSRVHRRDLSGLAVDGRFAIARHVDAGLAWNVTAAGQRPRYSVSGWTRWYWPSFQLPTVATPLPFRVLTSATLADRRRCATREGDGHVLRPAFPQVVLLRRRAVVTSCRLRQPGLPALTRRRSQRHGPVGVKGDSVHSRPNGARCVVPASGLGPAARPSRRAPVRSRRCRSGPAPDATRR